MTETPEEHVHRLAAGLTSCHATSPTTAGCVMSVQCLVKGRSNAEATRGSSSRPSSVPSQSSICALDTCASAVGCPSKLSSHDMVWRGELSWSGLVDGVLGVLRAWHAYYQFVVFSGLEGR
ncbi:hypothetical protein CTRI78_v003122 [Colletotrichum trifolii]|uniref:Uncharacterized protein n=1 Tax=Colletotrichum trifolii TaxID=5466 RepID=A0A4R8RK71_COLTR|nr:hypothetical protein CTRI78_v003122 [Colletotrichum trifolii]